ncbi:L-lactate dehydrogenase [Gracilibacillus halophilus YIM-C55.5]|uniref:L-lactate dehydrogenase n=1 Tax=Gracilibacillus halophilus YIM-C55.5 TaxID=1308866 RepID=N4WCE7_9BACI|nr:L-lactate dehydrogenase [Gracilibacillus halophilus YIM-C55.5]
MKDIFDHVRDAAYQIIERKGATYYGIGLGLVRLTKAILNNENSIVTISAQLNGEYNADNVYIGVPAVVNEHGIREVIELDLTDAEQEQFQQSVDVIKKMNQTALGAMNENGKGD